MTTERIGKYFYQSPNGGFMYDTAAEAAERLLERPEEIQGYIDGMYRLANGVASWGMYGQMRDTLNLLVDVLIEIDEQRGKAHR